MELAPIEWIVVGIAVGVIYLSLKNHISGTSASSDFICANCGTCGQPSSQTRGSFFMEIILWLCFIIPGLIYSIWRLTTRRKVCPSCGHDAMIPADTPRGRQLSIIQQFKMPE